MLEINSKDPRGVDLPMSVGNDDAKMFAGPETLAGRVEWRNQLHTWRTDAAERINYQDLVYRDSKLSSITDFNIALIWLWDELLFDFESGNFTPGKLLADSQKFGGLDGIILWHAYPVIGIDSRNQFDFYNDVPGLAKLIADLQLVGVKVYLNYNPWDRWTKRAGESDQQELADLVAKFGFDGLFLDTMKSADPDFMAPILKVNPKITIAGESRVQQERICDHVMSWAQWFSDSEIPGVIRAKWFEPRHMLHQTRRWNRSHIDELNIAWLNGAGMLLWEVVFGAWVGWNRRESQMWQEMVAILREHNELLTSGEWEPLTQLSEPAEAHGLYASKFSKNGTSLYTIVNKSVDEYHGEILPKLIGTVPGNGVGAVVSSEGELALLEFSYSSLSSDFPEKSSIRIQPLSGVAVQLSISFRNRECGLYDGAPFVDAWKPLPPNFHQLFTKVIETKIRLGHMESNQVTNNEYHQFLQSTGYTPKQSHRFLSHWQDGSPKADDLDNPVSYLDLADAKAYATWKKLVIPTEFEWQAYAQDNKNSRKRLWNLTDSVHSDGRTRFLILKGGSSFGVRNGQGAKSTSGIAESDWYVDGGVQDASWVEKLLLMGAGMSRSENIGFTCFRLATAT